MKRPILIACVSIALGSGLLQAQVPTVQPTAGQSLTSFPPASPDADMQSAVNDSLSEMVRQEIIDNLQGDYQDADDWGQTKDAFHGFKIKTHDWHVKVQKRTKPVKHGLWKKYQVRVVDPARRLQVQVGSLHPAGPGRLTFQVALAADLHGEARFERWRQGIKMLNFSAEADSRVNVKMDCEVGFRLVSGKFLSDIVIEPQVKRIDIQLVDLDVQRVSKIEGLAAHEIGNALRGTLAEQLSKRGPKLAAKMNKSIDKRRDKLRFSPDEFVTSGWSKLQGKLGYQPAPSGNAPANDSASAEKPATTSPAPTSF